MDFKDYRDAFARNLWVIVLLGVVGLAVGVFLPKSALISKNEELPQYSTLTIVGAPPSLGNNSAIPPGVSTSQIVYYAASQAVYTQTAYLAHVDEPGPLVRSYFSIEGPCDNCSTGEGTLDGTVNVTVKAPSASESADLNNSFDLALGQAINNGARQLGGGPTGFQVLDSTQPSFAAVSKTAVQTSIDSRPIRAVSGLLIGLVLGILVTFVRLLLDKRVSSIRRAQAAIGYPVVAEIPASASDSREAYRMLWLSVFREPLPEPVERGVGRDPWLDGAELMTDSGTWPGFES
jgi:hypothetical protein